MARAALAARLGHILDAAAKIERQTAGKSFEDYAADYVTRDVVERELERISEASRHVPDPHKAHHSEVPWRLIADLGNVLRHAYDQIVDQRIWDIVTTDLKPLKVAIEAILRVSEAKGRK